MYGTRSRILALAAAIVLAGGLTAGCSSNSDAGASTGAAELTPSAGVVSVVDPASFAAAIDQPGVTVIDVRTPQEFAAGHIASAINMNMQDANAFAEQLSTLDPDATYAVYCRSGNRSATATAEMRDAGFGSLLDLDGGIVAWQAAGLPVVS